jgi:hypothetical protein
MRIRIISVSAAIIVHRFLKFRFSEVTPGTGASTRHTLVLVHPASKTADAPRNSGLACGTLKVLAVPSYYPLIKRPRRKFTWSKLAIRKVRLANYEKD